MATINLVDSSIINQPFKHFIKRDVIQPELSRELLNYFEHFAQWNSQSIDRFYDSYNLNLLNATLPDEVKFFSAKRNIQHIKQQVEELYQVKLSNKIDVAAHKLIQGQSIRIHNDLSPIGQSHRLLIQINRGWKTTFGGILMLLDSEDPEDVTDNQKFYLPENGSSVLFQISSISFHAVSEVLVGNRYTLVYSFYQ